jgi:hypothetical protein
MNLPRARYKLFGERRDGTAHPASFLSCPSRIVRHATKGAARAEVSRLVREGSAWLSGVPRPGKMLEVYRCGSCGGWHVAPRVTTPEVAP